MFYNCESVIAYGGFAGKIETEINKLVIFLSCEIDLLKFTGNGDKAKEYSDIIDFCSFFY